MPYPLQRNNENIGYTDESAGFIWASGMHKLSASNQTINKAVSNGGAGDQV
ncbi:MAG: hypothetical protein IPG78_18460 [Ignavibacteria bacterium]|nr:hypothetical protein [Ignavibacteria bacterium]